MFIFLTATACMLLWMLIESRLLKPEYLRLDEKQLNIRVAFLSDIHIGLLAVSSKKLKKAMNAAAPDLLLISGDLVDRKYEAESFIKWFKSLNLNIPVYVTLGNHEHTCFKKDPLFKDVFMFNLRSLGIKVLINQSASFEKGNKILNIIGIDDYKSGKPDLKQAFSGMVQKADLNLSLSHNPDIALQLSGKNTDLLLCGHFHGGQIWMPFKLEYKLFRNEITCRKGFLRGINSIDGIRTYISRGLGNVVIPLRLGSRPEITFIDL